MYFLQTKDELILLGFSENEALILLEFLQCEIFSSDDFIGKNLNFDLSQYNFCEIRLTFKNAKLITKIPEDCQVTFDDAYIIKNVNCFSLAGKAYYYTLDTIENDIETESEFCMDFDSIDIAAKSLKTKFEIHEGLTPWEALADYASCIYEKIERPYLTATEKEKALEPLLRELHILACWYREFYEISFDTLSDYLPENPKLYKQFEKVKNCKNSAGRWNKITNLFHFMSDGKFESSWRSILKLLDDSQAEYEDKNNSEISYALRNEHKRIEKIMHDNGYNGAYPTFEKTAKIKNIHIAKSNNDLYFVGRQEATIFIECRDNIFEDSGNIKFQIFTLFGKPDKSTDKYDCLFAKKGKGNHRTRHMMYEINDSGEIDFMHTEKQIPYIVCKAAEFKKLSKTEKKEYGLLKSKQEIMFTMSFFMIIGIFFGIFITLGFMLLEFLVTLFLGLISDFPQLFSETPWLMLFLFAWLVSGAVMGILSILTTD